tara:strand:+ start:714 stop:1142 length:429 start_codon:yes stop_codon:yes gene_type:complete
MNKKAILYTVGGIATIIGGYYAYKRITQPTEYFGTKPSESSPSSPSSSTSSSSSSNNEGLPLKRGSKGEKVTQLQKFLVSEGYSIGAFGILSDGVDGDFGRMTETAVKENQKPFATFKSMYPTAVEGQVSADFFNSNIKGKF